MRISNAQEKESGSYYYYVEFDGLVFDGTSLGYFSWVKYLSDIRLEITIFQNCPMEFVHSKNESSLSNLNKSHQALLRCLRQ